MKKIVVLFILSFISSITFAHSGGTNSCGAHNNHKTDNYHVHDWDKYQKCYPSAIKSTLEPSTEPIIQASNAIVQNPTAEIKAETLETPVITVEKLAAESTWINQRGSTLTIESISLNGLLTGIYINNAIGYGCQKTPYPVTGWVSGTAITFTTQWTNVAESCHSITAWTGFLYENQITTLWQLVNDGSTNTSQIAAGEDVYKLIEAPNGP